MIKDLKNVEEEFDFGPILDLPEEEPAPVIAFESIEFYGINSIEPEFSPEITSYTIHRAAGSNFQFRAKLNIDPLVPTEDDGWNFAPFPGYTLSYHESGAMYKSFWSHNQWSGVGGTPGESSFSISCTASKRSSFI